MEVSRSCSFRTQAHTQPSLIPLLISDSPQTTSAQLPPRIYPHLPHELLLAVLTLLWTDASSPISLTIKERLHLFRSLPLVSSTFKELFEQVVWKDVWICNLRGLEWFIKKLEMIKDSWKCTPPNNRLRTFSPSDAGRSSLDTSHLHDLCRSVTIVHDIPAVVEQRERQELIMESRRRSLPLGELYNGYSSGVSGRRTSRWRLRGSGYPSAHSDGDMDISSGAIGPQAGYSGSYTSGLSGHSNRRRTRAYSIGWGRCERKCELGKSISAHEEIVKRVRRLFDALIENERELRRFEMLSESSDPDQRPVGDVDRNRTMGSKPVCLLPRLETVNCRFIDADSSFVVGQLAKLCLPERVDRLGVEMITTSGGVGLPELTCMESSSLRSSIPSISPPPYDQSVLAISDSGSDTLSSSFPLTTSSQCSHCLFHDFGRIFFPIHLPFIRKLEVRGRMADVVCISGLIVKKNIGGIDEIIIDCEDLDIGVSGEDDIDVKEDTTAEQRGPEDDVLDVIEQDGESLGVIERTAQLRWIVRGVHTTGQAKNRDMKDIVGRIRAMSGLGGWAINVTVEQGTLPG
ncbi:hypothetical protein AX16_010030 [Volvariella volvacea WC 439]|nr:hypothetical protein AX16_010030 [Volvariella volvacea WC 439]